MKIMKINSSPIVFLSIIGLALLVILGLSCLSGCAPTEPNSTDSPGLSSEPNSGAETGSGSGSSSANKQEQTKVAEGYLAPDFSFTTVDGEEVKLSDYQGKVVILNFWASWCGLCVKEMPAMQDITEDYSNVVVLAVNRGETVSKVTSFVEDNPYDFVWGVDENASIMSLYPSSAIPYSIIIDGDGTIVSLLEGSYQEMYPYFEEQVKAAGA